METSDFLQLTTHLPDALLLVADGIVLAANPLATTLLTDGDSVAGKRLEDFLTANGDQFTSFLRASARSRTPAFGLLRTSQNTSSEYRAVGSLLTPAVDGNPARLLLRLVPKQEAISGFLALNQKIEELSVEIERRVAVEEKLRAADRRKDEFLAMLAHELRNPLAPIQSGLDLLRLQLPECDTVKVMGQQLQHLVRLVDDLLDVSRVMRGEIRLNRRPVQLQTLVEIAIDTSRPAIESYGHQLTAELPDAEVWINADDVRISQVITNLLNNAAKYTPNGGLIELRISVANEEVTISVADNGVGIEPDYLPEIFRLFSQADSTLDRSAGGLGIGLTVVERLVHLHGGTISAQSNGLGLGSLFEVSVPTIPAPLETADCSTATGTGNSITVDRLRILVVDDSKGAAKMLQRILSTYWQHEIQLAHDGTSACAVARSFRPDMIFLDIGLPGRNGYEVAETLRAEPEFARTKIIALTGYGAEADKKKSQRSGFDMHLVKPVSVDLLRNVFSQLAAAT